MSLFRRRAGFLPSYFMAALFPVLSPAFIAPPQAFADEPAIAKIHVSGEGKVSIAPDMATLSFGVMREAKTAREALSANNAAMEKVIDALKAEGVEAKDLQTSDFTIHPRYSRPKQGEHDYVPEIIGYSVSNNLAVHIRDLEKLGEVLDKSVTLGVNTGGNIQFGNSDSATAIEQARVKAVKDALAKAKTLTQAAGIELGDIIEIRENSMRPEPAPMARSAIRMESAAHAVPVEAGQNSYFVSVRIVLALKQ